MTSSAFNSENVDGHYSAVIVGSGFGGSVMAYRLAEAGLKVCLLERGRAYPPNSFPRTPYRMKRNFWDPSAGLYGLFNIWSFRGLGSVVSSGLGGGSLIYANVSIRKDEKWFVKEDIERGGYEYWPVNREDLDPHYDRVERMLKVKPYPFDRSPYNKTGKTRAMQQAAGELQLDWFLPNLAVTFANEGEEPVLGEPIKEQHPNLHHQTRSTCRLCGECDLGCNYGSKNTLDYNYLSEAKRQGAEIKTLCEVRSFEPRPGGGYLIHYVEHDLDREGQPCDTGKFPLITISADQLILSAGTLGSTYLLLKNRSAFPHIGDKLGTRFGGNGDLLALALKAKDTQNGQQVTRILDPSYGPVITSSVRVPGQEDGGEGRGFYIQDAGYPDFINWMAEIFQTIPTLWGLRIYLTRLICAWVNGTGPQDSDLSSEISRLLGTNAVSSGSLPLLGMGRDIPDGRMKLRGGKLDVDWTKFKSDAFFGRLRDTMEAITGVWGAKFQDNPTWYLNRLITVHALGGCPMGRDENEGVVDSYGEVFNYPGLFVADGAVMPGPVGPNPSLTIAALSDRFAERAIENHEKSQKSKVKSQN
jgi:cholesterol oxidase